MFLITGAGGKTGRVLLKSLSKSEHICALVYHNEQVPLMTSLGAAKVMVGDMRDERLLISAMDGVHSVYHICPNMSPDEIAIGRLVIGAAQKRGIGHFVYHSVLHPQTEKMDHHWQKLRVEEMILESGLPFTILQPAPYMQNLLASRESILEKGVLRVPYSVHSKLSFVDLEDIAEAAKVILTEPGHRYAVYELAGTLPMSHVDAADTIGRVLERNIQAEEEAIGEWRLRAEQSGIRGYALENLVKMFDYYNRWGLPGNPNVLQWLLKRESASLEEFVRRLLKEQDTFR